MDASGNALRELRKFCHNNYDDKRFPQSYLSLHTTERHIQIYMLVSEYVELYEDLAKVTASSAKVLIKKRIDEVKRELMQFWIATDDEMIPKKGD